MKKFKQLKKFGPEVLYVKPASIKEHTITNSAYDLLMDMSEVRPRTMLEWCETANIDAQILGTVFWRQPRSSKVAYDIYTSYYVIRIRNTVGRALFAMNFDTTPAPSGRAINSVIAD